MKWRLILLLVTFWVCFSGFACSRKTELPAGHPEVVSAFEPFPEGPGRLEADLWYVVELQGKPAGWVHTRAARHETPRGARWVTNTEELISVHRGAERLESRTQERHLENQAGQLLRSWQMVQEQGGEKVEIQAGKVAKDMITVRGPEVRRVSFEPQALASQRCFKILFAGKAPQAEEVKDFRSYDPPRAGYADNRIVVKSAGPQTTILEHTTTSLPGVVARVELDKDYSITRMEFLIGSLHFVQRQVDEKPDLSQGGSAPNIDALMVIPSDTRMENPRRVVRAQYRIQGLPEFVDSSWLSAPGQRVVEKPGPGVFLVEVETLDDPSPVPFPPDAKKPELSQYLASTSLTRLDDPRVMKTARDVTAKSPDAWTAAKRLRQWVSDEISGDLGMGFASASQVLSDRKGDCSEQSVLLAALARSVGIPARCVMGLVYQDDAFFRHMWTEVWVGRWQPLDPAQATDHISAAWIRLAVHSLQLTDDQKSGAGGLMLFGARLKVAVESFETSTP